MTALRIYAPTQSAMTSGNAKSSVWRIELSTPENTSFTDPIMGWQGGTDTRKQINLTFDTKEAAIRYAEKRELTYEVIEPKQTKKSPKSYSDNFNG